MIKSTTQHLLHSIACVVLATSLIGAGAFLERMASGQVPTPTTQRAQARQPGRGALSTLTTQQSAVFARLTAQLAASAQSLDAARTRLLSASLAWPADADAVDSAVDAVAAADASIVKVYADRVAELQALPDKLTPEQVAAMASNNNRRRPGQAPPIPNLSSPQASDLTTLTGIVQPLAQAVAGARARLVQSALALPRDDGSIKHNIDLTRDAELKLATARADAFAKIQNTPHKLAPDQIAAFHAMGGVLISGAFSEPGPIDFNDHAGYVSLFDGTTLKGWDGNPKFWRAEDGAIIGESTPQNPSGNTYLVYRDVEAKDFTLKFEIKVEGTGGSGLQYRSKSGIPWLTAVAPNVTANTGPLNLNWMLTGPQADFWPVRVYSGQFYSENTPMRIMAWRGQVVEGAGLGPRRLMGNIGDRQALGKLVNMNDWNQYTVIARGGTFIHIINGQLMAVMIDDDPESSNNQPGLFGVEIEATTKVSVRNLWLKKLN